MSRKNFKVATDENNQTTLVKIEKETKVPTGKVTTIEDKKKRKEARELAYKNFRIAALKRRATRMGLSEEDTKKAIEQLTKQLEEPNNYMILLLFNPNNKAMIVEQLKNNNIEQLISSNSHMYVEGDAAVLAKIRELVPEGTKIYPYVKKKPAILPVEDPPKARKKPLSKAEKKSAAKNAKTSRKEKAIEAHLNHKEHAKQRKEAYNKKKRKEIKAQKLFKKRVEKVQKKKAKIAQMSNKKASTGLKKAA